MNITYIIDIQVITLTIIPIFLGIGSILLNVRIMNINVLKFIIYYIFYIVNYKSLTPFGASVSLSFPWNISLPYSSMISPNEGFMTLVDMHIG